MSTIACWCCRALCGDRSNTLAFILNTMGSLGTKLSLDKGSRASRATWLGVSLHLIDKDTLVVGLREKAIDDIDELQGIFGKWENAGYAPVKELRVVSVGCIAYRARWTTSVFAVLSRTFKEDEGASPRDRKQESLFAVNLLELARLSAAKLRPMRRI